MALFSECMPGVLEERLTLPTLLETPDYNTWKSIHRANPLFSGSDANTREAVLAALGFLRSEWACSSHRKCIRRSRT